MAGPDASPHRGQYALFDTPIGPCGVAWSGHRLTRLQLPESDQTGTERRLGASGADRDALAPPPEVERAIADVRRYLAGEPIDFRAIALDLDGVSPFHRKVYDAARSVGWGETASYADLARIAGSPAAARAVGQAMARNPVAIIIPCHRILASGGKLGGFSAFGGRSRKECLLALEGVHLDPPKPAARPAGRIARKPGRLS
jgi:methylated-DNA-[protein]-cysteine S-methyltransferase